MRTWIGSAALAAVIAAALPAAAQDLKIGAINPYSGPLAQFGDEVARGYDVAADEINAKGGLLGRKVVMVRGDAGNPQQGISAAEKLIGEDKVELLIGSYISAVSNAASDAAGRYGKIYWETHGLASELTERGLPNYVRGGPNASFFAETSVKSTVDIVAPKLGKPVNGLKVWIEHEDTIYGTSIAQLQKKLFEAAGAKVVGVGSHSFRAIDLTDSILRASNAAPDVWIATGYVPDNTLLLRTMRDQGFAPGAVMLVGTGDGVEFGDALKDFMTGVFVVGYPHPDLPESFAPGAGAFVQAYTQKYGKPPAAPQSLEGYSVVRMLADAVTAAGSTDMAKLRAAAVAMDKPVKTYANGFGAKFDDKMQNTRAVPNVTQWQNGKPRTVYPVDARQSGIDLVNVPRKN